MSSLITSFGGVYSYLCRALPAAGAVGDLLQAGHRRQDDRQQQARN